MSVPVSDIPWAGVSSCGLLLVEVVAPSGLLVVADAGLEAAVEDADQPVGELPQRGVMPDAPSPQGVVVGAGPG
jgi:hypothetical protein